MIFPYLGYNWKYLFSQLLFHHIISQNCPRTPIRTSEMRDDRNSPFPTSAFPLSISKSSVLIQRWTFDVRCSLFRLPLPLPHSHRGVGISPYGPEAAFRIPNSPPSAFCSLLTDTRNLTPETLFLPSARSAPCPLRFALCAMLNPSPFRIPTSQFSFHNPIRLKFLMQRLARDTQAAGGFTLIAAAGFKGV